MSIRDYIADVKEDFATGRRLKKEGILNSRGDFAREQALYEAKTKALREEHQVKEDLSRAKKEYHKERLKPFIGFITKVGKSVEQSGSSGRVFGGNGPSRVPKKRQSYSPFDTPFEFGVKK